MGSVVTVAGLLAACRDRDRAAAGSPPPRTVRYGAHPSQHADLHLPAGSADRLPVAVVVHGGFWRATYGYRLGTPLAADLAARGWAAWNLEYRRVGDGGGWPATFEDVAAGIDALAGPGQQAATGRLDLGRVVAVGHSAGGHLALWAGGRPRLPSGSIGAEPRIRLTGVVSQAGVADLVHAAEHLLGAGAAVALLGGSPAEQPERYRLASPTALVPVGVPVALVHGEDDQVVPIAQSERFAAAAARAGDRVTLTRLSGIGHFELIDPTSTAWAACRAHLDRLR
jgi:acetyl esterase/lipase